MKKLFVLLFATGLALCWSASAFAEATPYASIRFLTFYKDVQGNDTGSDATDLVFGLTPNNNTRLGVKFKVSDEVSGLVEVNAAVALRHAFGVYKFGAGELLVGQTWRPYTYFAPYVYDDSAGSAFGASASRTPQMRLTFKPGVYVALLKSNIGGTSDDDAEFPELAVGYKGKFGVVNVGIHGAYATVDDSAKDEESWVVAVNADAKLGAVKIGGRAFYGDDTGGTNFGYGATGGDLNSYGGFAYVTAYPSDKVAITGLVGYVATETANDDNDRLLLAVNAPLKITKGFTVVPEIAYVDGLENGNGLDDADELYIGAKWQFDL